MLAWGAAAAEFDLDAPFQRPQPALEPETTLRDQIELAIARLEGTCSPDHAEELRARSTTDRARRAQLSA